MTTEEKCPWGCIFYPDSDQLYGDCRMPESKDCFFNKEPGTKDSLESCATQRERVTDALQ